jgi:hypothetical protein
MRCSGTVDSSGSTCSSCTISSGSSTVVGSGVCNLTVLLVCSSSVHYSYHRARAWHWVCLSAIALAHMRAQ